MSHKRSSPHVHEHLGRPMAPLLELVLKADTSGTLDAAAKALDSIAAQGAPVKLIERSVGQVAKSDLTMALTGSRLVVGFGVEVLPKVEELARDLGVEVRLYDLLPRLVSDVESLAGTLVPTPREERVTGTARVIALFKSSRKGIILGCEVTRGVLAVHKPFRVITSAGPIYQGTIESLQIGSNAVREAHGGQQVGVKVPDFQAARLGDLVECYEPLGERGPRGWIAVPGVRRLQG